MSALAETASAPAPSAAPVPEATTPTTPTASVSPVPTKPEALQPERVSTTAQDTLNPPKSAGTRDLVWPDLPAQHNLARFFSEISEITKEADYSEVYGIELSPENNPFHTKLILQKFLRANADDFTKARAQLLATLKWRKEFQPLKAMAETFSADRFKGLGYIVTLDKVPESTNERDVVTFNIYGAVKDIKNTFGDIDGFLRWRVGIMERSVHKLNIAQATEPIPDYGKGPDPYQGYQVHDYRQISFLRMDPHIRAVSKKTVETLQAYYPETLSRKFFVNVPVIMGWAFAAMKLLASKETVRKFTVLSYAEYLAGELGPGVPKEYGGDADELEVIGEALALTANEGK